MELTPQSPSKPKTPAQIEARKVSRRASNKAWQARNPEKVRAYASQWKVENPEKIRAGRAAWMSKPINRVRHILGQAKRRAKGDGREFNITLDDLLPLPDVCPVLGIPINYAGTGAAGFVNDSPSIDRIDSASGYVKGNVRIISWRANRIKTDASLAELRALVAYMEAACS